MGCLFLFGCYYRLVTQLRCNSLEKIKFKLNDMVNKNKVNTRLDLISNLSVLLILIPWCTVQ